MASSSMNPDYEDQERYQQKREELRRAIKTYCIGAEHEFHQTPLPNDLTSVCTLAANDASGKIDVTPLLSSQKTFVALASNASVMKQLIYDLRATCECSSDEVDRLSQENSDLRKELDRQQSQREESLASNSSQQLTEILNRLTRSKTADKRSAKLPDPESFSGEEGKGPQFRQWKVEMQNKLEVNRDHFPSTLAKTTYVFSRTAGNASSFLRPYMQAKSSQVGTLDNIMDLLTATFDDPHFVENKRQELRRLYQRNLTFGEFHTRFITLATDAEKPVSEWFEEMWYRLCDEMRRQLIAQKPQMKGDFNTLVMYCREVDREVRAIEERKNRTVKRDGRLARATEKEAGARPDMSKEHLRKNFPRRSPEEQVRMRQEGRCFHCQQKGHMAHQCPKKKALLAVLNGTSEVRAPSGHVVEEVSSGSESEN